MFKKKFPSLSSLGSDGNTAFLRAARAGHLDKVLEHLKANIDINTSNTNGLNALHLASKDGHVDVVTELLKRGAVVDSATKKGNTALHIASLAGQEEVVKLLVANGASVNVQSQNGFTPLYMAAQENHDNVVRFLLANGANQSLATEDGFTPLAVAMQQGHDKVVAVLLENDTRGKVRLPALHIAAKKDDCKAAALLLQNDHNPDVTSKSGFTPLHIAAHYGNEGIGNLLLSRGADVNYSAKHNISPLHVAAKWGKTNLVSLLLEKGANIESKTRDGLTPLHCAARSGHEQVVDMLLERGAPISSKTKNGLAPLHMAAQGDHVDAARILLYHRAPVDEVTVDYLTALHVAAHCGHVRVAKLLLDRKADPNARALNGFTPLHIACKKNRIKVVELLLKHGASIEATTESGLTPLHVASFMGCMNIVIFLLQNDASPDVPTVRGETPLHLAARANQTDIIRILLRNGAQVDARAREQQTPLHIASRLGNVDIVMLLLQHGAAVDSTTKDMYTALHIAAKEGQEEVASVLLEHGASLTATTKKGFTPLHLAAKYGNIKVAKLLLQKEAPVDAQGKNGVTPLHVASHYDHQNVALLLLDKGASPHATAKNGHTPLHIAARKNQMDIATTLLEYGAKANAESKAGFTPLHLSSQEGHNDMSTLLIEHQADTNHKAKNGLTPLHLCAQEDRVNVAAILVKNGAQVDSTTKAGYTPLHVASHFGQVNMIRFLLQHGADVKATTSIGYTPLHQAAQQGHTTIVNLLLENAAPPNIQTNQGQTPLSIAQKLGYISVVETLKVVTEPTVPSTIAVTDEKYRVVAPETMQETFMSDSEDEGGEETTLADQPYRYLTVDEMKSLGDDSLPIDVTRDERMDSNREHMAPPQAVDDTISPQHIKESYAQYAANYTPDNVELARHPVHVGFLVSFLVDARGGAMRGCRHSGVRVIVPPRKASQPIRVTCRYLKRDKLTHPPPLMEGEALASRILELGPVGAKFLGPVIIEVPHFGSLRGMEREIVILRSDNGETWREHTMEASDEAVHEVLNESFEADEISALEEPSSGRTTRILTTDFPQYFAIVSRIRQEVHAIGPEGGMVSSTVVPQVQAVFPQGALTKKIKVGLQAQPIPAELAAKLLGNRVAVSPIVTVEPRRRKFHKPITLTIPVPQAANKGMINQYSGDAPTLRLLCSITGGTTRAQWEDVTGSTPLTFVNDCVSFTTTVSARFWLMDCRNIAEATKMATELYREAIHVPFMAKFVVFAKRVDVLEARLRVFCMTDDKEDKTLEHQEHFTEVAKSRDVEVLEGKPQFVEFSGNLVPVTKSGDQLQLGFRAFRENRLPFTVRVKDPHADTVGRIMFMREGRIAKGEPPQQPICILNIVLPENIVPETSIMEADLQALNKKYSFLRDGGLGRLEAYQRTDLRLSDISNLLGEDWVPLAGELNITNSEVDLIKSECPDSSAQQAMAMLRLWMQQQGNKANARALESALRKLGRDDIVHQCIFTVDSVDRAIGRVKLDQSGFDSLKDELGPSRDASLGRNVSLDAAFDERDIMKESESVEELVLQEKVKPTERLKEGRRDSDETETKYIGEEKVVVEEQKSVSELKEIFAADKRDRQYERQPVIGAMGESGRPVSMVEQVVKRKISTSDDRPKSAVEIVEKTVKTVKEDEPEEEEEEEKSLSVEEIRKRFSVGEDKDEKTVTTTVTKVTKKISGIPVAAPKTPETTKKTSGIPTFTQKTTEIQETITKTIDDGSKKTSEVKGVVTTTLDDGSKKVTETVSQKTSGIPKPTQKIAEAQEVVKTVETREVSPKLTETVTTQKISGIPVISTKTTVIESVSPKPSEVISTTTQEVTVSTKASGIPVVTKTTKVTEKITKTLEDGKEVVTKTIDGKKQQIFDTASAEQRRDSELFQGVSEELGRLETTFKVASVEDGILSPKVAKTPPPSPAEFSREQTGGHTAWTAGGPLPTEHHLATQEWTGKAQDTEPEPSDSVSECGLSTVVATAAPSSDASPLSRPHPDFPELTVGMTTPLVNKLITGVQRQHSHDLYTDMSRGSREGSLSRDTPSTASPSNETPDVGTSEDKLTIGEVLVDVKETGVCVPGDDVMEQEEFEQLIMYDSSPTFFRKKFTDVAGEEAAESVSSDTLPEQLGNIARDSPLSTSTVGTKVSEVISSQNEGDAALTVIDSTTVIYEDVELLKFNQSDSVDAGVEADKGEIDVQMGGRVPRSFLPGTDVSVQNLQTLENKLELEGDNVYIEPDILKSRPSVTEDGYNLVEYFPELVGAVGIADSVGSDQNDTTNTVHVYEEIETSTSTEDLHDRSHSGSSESKNQTAHPIAFVQHELEGFAATTEESVLKGDVADFNLLDYFPEMLAKSPAADSGAAMLVESEYVGFSPRVLYENTPVQSSDREDDKVKSFTNRETWSENIPFWSQDLSSKEVPSPITFRRMNEVPTRVCDDIETRCKKTVIDNVNQSVISANMQDPAHNSGTDRNVFALSSIFTKSEEDKELLVSAKPIKDLCNFGEDFSPQVNETIATSANVQLEQLEAKVDRILSEVTLQEELLQKQTHEIDELSQWQKLVSPGSSLPETGEGSDLIIGVDSHQEKGKISEMLSDDKRLPLQLGTTVDLTERVVVKRVAEVPPFSESGKSDKFKTEIEATVVAGIPQKVVDDNPWLRYVSPNEHASVIARSESPPVRLVNTWEAVPDDSTVIELLPRKRTKRKQGDQERPRSFKTEHLVMISSEPLETENVASESEKLTLQVQSTLASSVDVVGKHLPLQPHDVVIPIEISDKNVQEIAPASMSQVLPYDQPIVKAVKQYLPTEASDVQSIVKSTDNNTAQTNQAINILTGTKVFSPTLSTAVCDIENQSEVVGPGHKEPTKPIEQCVEPSVMDGSEQAESTVEPEPITEEYLKQLESSVDRLLSDIKQEEWKLGISSDVDVQDQKSDVSRESRDSTPTPHDDFPALSSGESDDVWWEGAYRDGNIPRPKSQEDYWESVRLENLGSDVDLFLRDPERGRDSYVSMSSQSDLHRRTSTGDEGDISSIGDAVETEYSMLQKSLLPEEQTVYQEGRENLQSPDECLTPVPDACVDPWEPQKIQEASVQTTRILDDGVNISRVIAKFPSATSAEADTMTSMLPKVPSIVESKLSQTLTSHSNTLPRVSKSGVSAMSSDQEISRLHVRSPGFDNVIDFTRTSSAQSLGAVPSAPAKTVSSSAPISKSLNILPILKHLKKPIYDRDDETPSPDLEDTTSSSSSSPEVRPKSQSFPLSSVQHLIHTPVHPVVDVPRRSSPLSPFYATPPPSQPTTPRLQRRTPETKSKSPSSGHSTPSPGYHIASSNLNKLPPLRGLSPSPPHRSPLFFTSLNPFSRSYHEEYETIQRLSNPAPLILSSTRNDSSDNTNYNETNPWYLQTEYHNSPSAPPAGYCSWFFQSDSRESTPRRGDAQGEWAPRDSQVQDATTTRGTDGSLVHGAAGSSGQATTETRLVEGSDDTMQELLDKLAAEQRK